MTINRRSIVLGLTVGLLAGGTGGALAATTTGSAKSGRSATATTRTGNHAWGGYGYGPGWSGYRAWGGVGESGGVNFGRATTNAAAAYLDLTTTEVKSRLRSGKTLADLAITQHKSVSGLENAIIAAITNSVQSDSALTAGQKATLTADAKARIDSIVENTCPVAGGGWFGAYQGPMVPY
jgi:hypothetical protein